MYLPYKDEAKMKHLSSLKVEYHRFSKRW